MLKRVAENVTFLGALFLFCGVDSSIWCGIVGLVLMVLFCLEVYIWEGGPDWERTRR